MSSELSPWENSIIGLLGGALEVSVNQPLNYLKNISQQKGKKPSFNPVVMYRGYPSNVLNMGSCTMWQFAVCGSVGRFLTGGVDRELSSVEDITCGLAAGVSSGLLGGPLELIMIQQQNRGGAVGATLSRIGVSGIYRGLLPTCAREGMWSVGYLAFPPIVRRYLMREHSETFTSEDAARVVASLIGALVSGVASHPFDTVKTNMQGDIEKQTFSGMADTFRKIYSQGGPTAFFRGYGWRFARQACGIFILDKVRSTLPPYVYPHRFE